MNDAPTTKTPTTTLHENEPASEAVVDAVADAEDVSPTDIRPPLYAAVDPDALDELVSSMARWSGEPSGRIVFPYAGYEVTVRGDGEVSLAKDESENEQ